MVGFGGGGKRFVLGERLIDGLSGLGVTIGTAGVQVGCGMPTLNSINIIRCSAQLQPQHGREDRGKNLFRLHLSGQTDSIDPIGINPSHPGAGFGTRSISTKLSFSFHSSHPLVPAFSKATSPEPRCLQQPTPQWLQLGNDKTHNHQRPSRKASPPSRRGFANIVQKGGNDRPGGPARRVRWRVWRRQQKMRGANAERLGSPFHPAATHSRSEGVQKIITAAVRAPVALRPKNGEGGNGVRGIPQNGARLNEYIAV